VSPDEPEHDAISVQAPDDRIYGGGAQRRSLEVEAASPAHSEAAAARYVEIMGRNLHPTVARRGLRIHGEAQVAESMPGGNVREDPDLRITRLLRGAAHCLTRFGQCPITGMHGRRNDRCHLRVRALRDGTEWIGQTPGCRAGGDAGDRAPDPLRVRSLPDRQPGGSSGRRAPDHGHNSGHNGVGVLESTPATS